MDDVPGTKQTIDRLPETVGRSKTGRDRHIPRKSKDGNIAVVNAKPRHVP